MVPSYTHWPQYLVYLGQEDVWGSRYYWEEDKSQSGASAMFTAEVPEKMIKNVTGHKSSKALAIYERPNARQQQALSGVLVGHSSNYLDRAQTSSSSQPSTSRSIPNTSMLTSSMFSGLNNCNITISPQNIHVHIQPTPAIAPDPLAADLDEFDAIVKLLPASGLFWLSSVT